MVPRDTRVVDHALEFARASSSNLTDSSFPAVAPTTTPPSGAGVTQFGVFQRQTPRYLMVMPFGDGADNSTFDLRLTGLRKVGSVWVPVLLCQLACTLSAATGVAGSTDLAATDRLADTLSVAAGNANVDVSVVSPGSDLPAHALVDLKGCPVVRLTVDLGTATGANALVAFL